MKTAHGAGLLDVLGDLGVRFPVRIAAAGDPPAMNAMGTWARDGIGQPRNGAEAVKWFRATADLLHDHALDNLGAWSGRAAAGSPSTATRR